MKHETAETSLPAPKIYPRSEHTVSRRDIDGDALKIMHRLIQHGYKGYLVGGGVRDLLLEKKPKDFDIATDATPAEIRKLFRNSRVIGRRFQLVHIYFRQQKIIEVSTFRDFHDPLDDHEVSDDLDAAQLADDNIFGNEATDAFRRDLTINGLFYDLATFSIIDYVGGMADFKKSLVRIIGNPGERFHEDPARMMRAVRHAVRAGFSIEKSCWQSIQKNHRTIVQCPDVRLYEELKKDLCSGHFCQIARLLSSAGLLEHLLPELNQKNAVLLSDKHPYAKACWKADEKIRKGENVPLTVMLGLIALFHRRADGDTNRLLETFPAPKDMPEFVSGAFAKLAVPRKEREKMSKLLSLWGYLAKTPFERISQKQLERRVALSDAAALFEVTQPRKDANKVLKIVGSALRKQSQRKSGKSKSKRHSRRKASRRKR